MSQPAAGKGYDLILKGGRVLDERNGVDGLVDVAIKAGKIAAVGASLPPGDSTVVDVRGAIVAPGLIDIHTHVYDKATSLSVDPSFIARRSAMTTMVDAGSAGAGNYDGFRDYVINRSPYRILAFLNISFPGIFGFDKGVSIGEARLREMLMTHIGTAPPTYGDVVSMLRPGDILTHCFRPDPNSALGSDRKMLNEVLAARERGVLFDIAHGMGAFGYDTTEQALQEGFKPDLISSDVHVIAIEGPAFDLLHTMSKLLNCGLSLPEVIGMSTNRPALAMRRPELGHLGIGAPADISVLRQVESNYNFEDVVGEKRQGATLLQPVAVYLGGKEMEIGRRPFEEPFIVGEQGHYNRVAAQ